MSAKRGRESLPGDERVVMLMVCMCGVLWGIWFYKPCKVEEAAIEEHSQHPPPHSLTSHPPLKGELYLHKSTSSKQQLFILRFSRSPLLPHPASPDIEPHEIYTAFKLNVNEGYVSLGLHGMMVEIP